MKKERRAARRLALQVLYEAEIRDMLPIEAYRERQRLGWRVETGEGELDEGVEEDPAPEVLGYARVLVEGVQEHHADVDLLIVRYADKWAIERMPVIDRSLLRIALYELMWGDAIPVAVAINEAVELAKDLSTEDSGRFINGVLGRIVEELPAATD
ncbi:MAG TPA: transcription antitermination factor NusB [Actinomycetota bacterium]|nr:transcription antitermination factor NusB [Actinomycetota bacterium]